MLGMYVLLDWKLALHTIIYYTREGANIGPFFVLVEKNEQRQKKTKKRVKNRVMCRKTKKNKNKNDHKNDLAFFFFS